ncbi:MAG: hypothetical protein ABIA93_06140 [Candidatus Woesearchaeota archaeon]
MERTTDEGYNIGDVVQLIFEGPGATEISPATQTESAIVAPDEWYRVVIVGDNLGQVLTGADKKYGLIPEQTRQTYNAAFGGHSATGHIRLVPKAKPTTEYARVTSGTIPLGLRGFILFIPTEKPSGES